jgi:large subunit ribosomal protein L22
MSQLLTVSAVAKGVSQTPRKVGLVASLVRGRTVADALVILEHTPKRAARPIKKVIESAKANALHNHGLQEKDMVLHTISVTAGPRLKRFRPVARGSAHPYQKRTSHIYVMVAGTEKPKKTSVKKAENKKESK